MRTLYRWPVVLLPFGLLLAGCRTLPPVRQTRHVLERRCGPEGSVRPYEYLVYLPDGYDDGCTAGKRWPLLLYLPGMLSSGAEKRNPIRGGPAMEVEEGRAFPFVMLTPFTPTFLERWTPELVLAFLDHALRTYRIDPERVYVTGASIGGRGAWDAAQAYPHLIAAIAPVAAWGCPWAWSGWPTCPSGPSTARSTSPCRRRFTSAS